MAIPETKEGLEEAGYVYDNDAVCRGCRQAIEWWITPKGKKMPMSVIEVRESLVKPVECIRRVPHWTDCPNAQDFRRPRSNP